MNEINFKLMPIYKNYNNHEINDIIDDAWKLVGLNQIYLFKVLLRTGWRANLKLFQIKAVRMVHPSWPRSNPVQRYGPAKFSRRDPDFRNP